jgi:hypothetical protein
MTRGPVALLTALLLTLPVSAAAADPVRVDSPAFQAAVAASVQHWGGLPCGGAVEYRWVDLPGSAIGYASWVRPNSTPDDPATFTSCRIDFDVYFDGGLDTLCTTLAHEMGHLHGHGHVDDPSDLMSPYVSEQLPECVAAMEPYMPAEAAEVAEVAAAPPAARKAKAQRRRPARHPPKVRPKPRKARAAGPPR